MQKSRKRRYPAKETYDFIDPTDRSHPIRIFENIIFFCAEYVAVYVAEYVAVYVAAYTATYSATYTATYSATKEI